MFSLVPIVDPEETIPAEWLRSALEATSTKNISLARRLGMDAATVSNWKTGKTPIAHARWMSIKLALGLPPDWTPQKKSKPQ